MTECKVSYAFGLEGTRHHFCLILLAQVSHMAEVKAEEKYTLASGGTSKSQGRGCEQG